MGRFPVGLNNEPVHERACVGKYPANQTMIGLNLLADSGPDSGLQSVPDRSEVLLDSLDGRLYLTIRRRVICDAVLIDHLHVSDLLDLPNQG